MTYRLAAIDWIADAVEIDASQWTEARLQGFIAHHYQGGIYQFIMDSPDVE